MDMRCTISFTRGGRWHIALAVVEGWDGRGTIATFAALWIPAFAGMTGEKAGMTEEKAGMTGDRAGIAGGRERE